MPKAKLTDAAVSRLALAPGQADLMFCDAELPGFGLRLRPAGRAWTVGYRPAGTGRSGNFKRLRIGSPDVLRTAEARAHARTVLAQIALGADPLADRAKLKAVKVDVLSDVLIRYEASLERAAAGVCWTTRREVAECFARRWSGGKGEGIVVTARFRKADVRLAKAAEREIVTVPARAREIRCRPRRKDRHPAMGWTPEGIVA